MIIFGTQRDAYARIIYNYVWPGIQGPNVAPPSIANSIILRQQQPWHPGSYLRRFQPQIRPPGTDFIFMRQEQPRHPRLLVWQCQKPQVGVEISVTNRVLMRQEQPFHPLWPKPIISAGTATAGETCFGYILG